MQFYISHISFGCMIQRFNISIPCDVVTPLFPAVPCHCANSSRYFLLHSSPPFHPHPPHPQTRQPLLLGLCSYEAGLVWFGWSTRLLLFLCTLHISRILQYFRIRVWINARKRDCRVIRQIHFWFFEVPSHRLPQWLHQFPIPLPVHEEGSFSPTSSPALAVC